MNWSDPRHPAHAQYRYYYRHHEARKAALRAHDAKKRAASPRTCDWCSRQFHSVGRRKYCSRKCAARSEARGDHRRYVKQDLVTYYQDYRDKHRNDPHFKAQRRRLSQEYRDRKRAAGYCRRVVNGKTQWVKGVARHYTRKEPIMRKPKPCAVCHRMFEPYSNTDVVCSVECRKKRSNGRKRNRAAYMREYRAKLRGL